MAAKNKKKKKQRKVSAETARDLNFNFPPNVLKFIQFLAAGKEWNGLKMTQEQFAIDVLGVRPETVTRYKQLPGFKEAVNALVDEYLWSETPAAIKALAKRMRMGDVKAIEIGLKQSGRWNHVEKIDANLTGNMQATVTLDERASQTIDRAIAAALTGLAAVLQGGASGAGGQPDAANAAVTAALARLADSLEAGTAAEGAKPGAPSEGSEG